MKKIKSIIEKMRQSKALRRKAVAKAQAEEKIQLCEFDKATYICVGGVPVINTKWLAPDLYVVLEDAREVSSEWIARRR